MNTFETGAKRNNDADDVRYDLISPHVLESLARTHAEGAKKYGDNNWQKGLPSSDLLNRVYRHLNLWRLGDISEDHLGHALWNLGAIVHFLREKPELVTLPFAVQEAERPPTCGETPSAWRYVYGHCSECGTLLPTGEHAHYCSQREGQAK